MQTKIEKLTNEKRILPWELSFYGVNGANVHNKTEIMCFQTFSPPWMQFSTVGNILIDLQNVLEKIGH